MSEHLPIPRVSPGPRSTLRQWWSVIAFFVTLVLAGLTGFANLKTDVAILDQRLKAHEQQQQETNEMLKEIRGDVKSLLKDSK